MMERKHRRQAEISACKDITDRRDAARRRGDGARIGDVAGKIEGAP
jgi:hypothetical protein